MEDHAIVPVVDSLGTRGWRSVLPGVFVWRDACNVYAVRGPSGAVIIDAGSGEWVDAVGELPQRPVALLATHFFRDHSAGARRAALELGIPIFVPETEELLFADPDQHFCERTTYVRYLNYWDHFAPVQPIPVAGVARDEEVLSLGGVDFRVIALPGATLGQVGYLFTSPASGQRAVCVGETIHSPGRVPRVAPLQYNYNDLLGAVEVFHSAGRLRALRSDALLPSLGEPILDKVDEALSALEATMLELCDERPMESAALRDRNEPGFLRISDHVWQATQADSSSWIITSDSGRALAIDYGFHHRRTFATFNFTDRHRKRALLHTLEELERATGIRSIDVVIPSHFHDDHVAGIPLLQRLHGTQCWAPDSFARLLKEPTGHAFPCNWPTPIQIDRVIEGETVSWEGIEFKFAPMSGHTRFSAMIGFEVDGIRYAHSGDQYSVINATSIEAGAVQEGARSVPISDWSGQMIGDVHVYRNGARIDGYAQSEGFLTSWRPDIVLNGHWAPFKTNDDFYRLIGRQTERYESLHRRAMPLTDADVHLDLDSWGGWIWPYRVLVAAAETATVTATVRNPLPRRATLEVRLVVPAGWIATEAAIELEPHSEGSCDLAFTPTQDCRRQPIAIDVRVDGRPRGQVAEALVTVGGSRW